MMQLLKTREQLATGLRSSRGEELYIGDLVHLDERQDVNTTRQGVLVGVKGGDQIEIVNAFGGGRALGPSNKATHITYDPNPREVLPDINRLRASVGASPLTITDLSNFPRT